VAAIFILGVGEQTQQEWEQGIADLCWQHVALEARQLAKTQLFPISNTVCGCISLLREAGQKNITS